MQFKVGEVRNYKKDKTKSGRVRVRIYGEHNDEQEVKDDDLPWAVMMHPPTDPGTYKLGRSPSGMVVGTRVLLGFLPEDVNCLYPIVIGTLPRGDIDKG